MVYSDNNINQLHTDTIHRWYVIHCYAGLESSIIESIKSNAIKEGIADMFVDFYVPKLTKSSDKSKNKGLYPGYIIVKMLMNAKSWLLISRTNKVVGFAGNNSAPIPLKDEELQKIFDFVENLDANGHLSSHSKLNIGDRIKIREGSFQSFEGTVLSVDDQKMSVTLSIKIFERETTIDLGWSQIELIQK